MSGSQRKCPIIWTQSSLLTEYELVSVHYPEKKSEKDKVITQKQDVFKYASLFMEF